MFVNTATPKKEGWATGVYVVQPFGPPTKGAKLGWVVVLEGAGGGCWYPTKGEAKKAAQAQNAELARMGQLWVYEDR